MVECRHKLRRGRERELPFPDVIPACLRSTFRSPAKNVRSATIGKPLHGPRPVPIDKHFPSSTLENRSNLLIPNLLSLFKVTLKKKCFNMMINYSVADDISSVTGEISSVTE